MSRFLSRKIVLRYTDHASENPLIDESFCYSHVTIAFNLVYKENVMLKSFILYNDFGNEFVKYTKKNA